MFLARAAVLAFLFAGVARGAENASIFEFKEPGRKSYQVELPSVFGAASGPKTLQWARAWPVDGSTNFVELSRRIVLELKPEARLSDVLEARPLRVSRTIHPSLFILEAETLPAALQQAEELARHPAVITAHPVMRRPRQLDGPYAPRPTDPFFSRNAAVGGEHQFNLENRGLDAAPLGPDLNVRAAWPVSRGAGVVIGIADDGVELEHPDLIENTTGAPHFNFHTHEENGAPMSSFAAHATAVAGLAAARGNNGIGISGVAPEARIASMVLFNAADAISDEETLMDAYQYRSNLVSIQNHSWGKGSFPQLSPLSVLESAGISNAVTFGRSGRGVIFVRSSGNNRADMFDVNEDGYPSDPRVITVASSRLDGRPARYSTPGASILVAAPSGDDILDENPCLTNSPTLITTDRLGPLGYNRRSATNDFPDYAFGEEGFSGTSGSAPQISGLAALLLGANPNLSYRDVQQILVHAGRHYDLAMSGLATNGAGFRVSHDLGYGVPDAGMAVALAKTWPSRPPLRRVEHSVTNAQPIPDDGLHLRLDGAEVPSGIAIIKAQPSQGTQPDAATALMTLADAGQGDGPLEQDLTGRAALIQRGEALFCEKISNVANVGAALAIIYNNRDGDRRMIMGATDFVPIPAVFIGQNQGEALRNWLGDHPETRLQLRADSVQYTFNVTETLICEHVAVRVRSDHSSRGDLRIVLTSPQGTKSVLQRVNQDQFPGPEDWTYHSTQHFYESSAGTWTLTVTDEDLRGTGSILGASLTVTGVEILDTDHDGLDDAWEQAHFGSLSHGPQADPDQDGFNNAREQAMGADPASDERPLRLDISPWDGGLMRLSWPSSTNRVYELRTGLAAAAPLDQSSSVLGSYYETEWFTPYTNSPAQFFLLNSALP